MWRRRPELQRSYDAVIIGGGSHGLATAYYLAKNHGLTDVCVLEKSYIGSGAAGRNTTIIRSNYRTPEGAEFYQRSVELYERLSAELGYNLMFSQIGHLTLAHTERAMVTMAERAEVNQLLGIRSRVVDAAGVKELCPEIEIGDTVTWPIMGALYHEPGGIIRHDAVVWGYARGADRLGVEIHHDTEVTGIERANGKVTGVQTTRGPIACDTVVSCTAGWSTLLASMVGVELPIWDQHSPSLRDRARQAVPRCRDRVLPDARLHLPDRPRRVPDRRRGRAVLDVLHPGDVPVSRVLGTARARALPSARRAQGASPVGPGSAT